MVFSSQGSFTEQPFNNTPDPKYFFPTKTHQEALSRLQDGIAERKGFLVLTGDVGTGKTTLCRTLLAKLGDNDVETALVLNPDLSETEILSAIARDFGLEAEGASKSQLMDLLYQHLVRRTRAGGNSLIIIDDAQNLPLRSLEQVRMISNFETAKEKLVQILLVGQPELTAKLPTQEFRQVRQRIAVNAQLSPLSAKETRDYIIHRLATAGAAPGSLAFTEQAFLRIHKETRGYPRSINTLCERILAVARQRRLHLVGPAVIEEQAQPLRMRLPLRARLGAHSRIVATGTAAVCAAVVAIVALHAAPRVSTAPAPAAVPAMAAATPDPTLQVKLAAVENSVAGLEKRLEQLRASPDVADSLLRQGEALEKNLSLARAESQRLNALLKQKEEELRALVAPRAAAGATAELAPALKQREMELQSALERFEEESRSRSEQVRHLEKALQTLKARLSEAERQREELSRNLQEKERQVSSGGDAGDATPDPDKLRAENAQLRRSNKLLQSLAEETIRAQSREIEDLKREKEQLSRGLGETGASGAAAAGPLAAAR
ncbi:MAG TPA: AAA family ATPase [Candidatus Methanoperedens sp.]|nr:AAA family ATPase [Candidatus Methanoperedens sp.]